MLKYVPRPNHNKLHVVNAIFEVHNQIIPIGINQKYLK